MRDTSECFAKPRAYISFHICRATYDPSTFTLPIYFTKTQSDLMPPHNTYARRIHM